MIRITAAQVTPAVRSLFRSDEMQARRCFAVLEGSDPTGKILVDNLLDPHWAVVQETYDHDLFLGGDMDSPTNAAAFAEVFAALRQEGDVLVGLPSDDPRLALFPADPYYDAWVLEFYDRPIGQGLEFNPAPVARGLRHPPSGPRLDLAHRMGPRGCRCSWRSGPMGKNLFGLCADARRRDPQRSHGGTACDGRLL